MIEEIRAYKEQLVKFKEYISVLKKYYIWIINNKAKIESIVNIDKQRVLLDQIHGFYINLDFRIENLSEAEQNIDQIKDNLEGESISTQYNNYLNKELLSINWSNYHLVNEYNHGNFNIFVETHRLEQQLSQNEYQFLDVLGSIFHQGKNYEHELIGKIASIKVFDQIRTIENNIVIIGPNGSGKSTFARSLNGKLSGTISIISAQHLLVYKNPSQIIVGRNMQEDVREFQKSLKLGSDENLVSLVTKDLENLLIALYEEKAERADKYYDQAEVRKKSILDQTIEIWESLITHRKLIHSSRYSIHVETYDNIQYEFNSLSDGEKAVFYFIGHVLLAEKDSYILIDEPENHLHLSICIKLWNILESKRSDCKFIYITHDLDFAISRNDKALIWNKDYKAPFSWDFSIIKEDEYIPERLLLEIMGSRRDVLFCEGDDRNSLDYKIYSRIFDDYNVIPVLGHENVVNYCKSFNANQHVGRLKAFGIIDGDSWSEEQCESFKSDNIFVLPFNEIENAICQKVFLEAIINETVGEPDKVNEFEEGLFKYAEKEKFRISTEYANNRINNHLKHNLLKERKDVAGLKREVLAILSEQIIDSYYNEMLKKIEDDIENKNFESMIVYLNGKKAISNGLGNKLIPRFEEVFIRLMDNRDSFKALVIEELRDKHF
ncbi:hypothetical protein J22TS1_05150 [Siminovitchia terrae]|uniref:AAA family ATPase n=1 Tax=Siminovitchia terrae TaxID=1914933 RepID=UPI001B06C4EE|nr:AAA family ATPase [Siminovitchia terrae]GIN89464.1 hypothetical protein J22TS1_05150 [Siminovitchia terrae]